MIIINKPYIEIHNGKARCNCDIIFNKEKKTLWFEVEKKYSEYLCTERADAYLIGLLHYAMQNNEDLEFYNSKLERLLGEIGLADDKIWLNQVNALVDKQDMSECRHRLVMRRKKIRDRLDDHRRIVQEERDEIDRLMINHEHYLPEIQEIIKSVDKLCGTSSSSAKKNA